MAKKLAPKPQTDLTELAFEVALRYYTPEELQVKYELTPEAYNLATENPHFQRLTLEACRNIDETGKQFKVLARKLATESLPNLFQIANDPMATHTDRISAINALARFGGFEKEETKGNTAFQININMS